jgi:hypothetical protein
LRSAVTSWRCVTGPGTPSASAVASIVFLTIRPRQTE